MLFLKRIHNNTLEWVNIQRINKDMEPLRDLPTGWRDEDGPNHPIAKALCEPSVARALAGTGSPEDFPEYVAMAMAMPCKEAAEVWAELFVLGFYSRYSDGHLYRPIKRRQEKARALRDFLKELPMDTQEKYLRLSAWLDNRNW